MATSYQRKSSEEQRIEVCDALEIYVKEGARQMLVAVLEEEVSAFWGNIAMSVAKHSAATGTGISRPER